VSRGPHREQLNLQKMQPEPDLRRWRKLATSVDGFTDKVKIGIVGKYTGLQDSYLSVIKVGCLLMRCIYTGLWFTC
jgi:CTP synthase (UTP-ammonia lyase)